MRLELASKGRRQEYQAAESTGQQIAEHGPPPGVSGLQQLRASSRRSELWGRGSWAKGRTCVQTIMATLTRDCAYSELALSTVTHMTYNDKLTGERMKVTVMIPRGRCLLVAWNPGMSLASYNLCDHELETHREALESSLAI